MRAPHDQHFLVDKKAVRKIAEAVDLAGKRVLEIGPGEGVLTSELLRRGAHVIAVELDRSLCSELENSLFEEIEAGQLTLICGDAIRCELPPFDIVVSNLPYSASSKITFRLLSIGFEVAVLMYQKEFGQRMIALPGTPAYGRLSVMVQTYASAKPILELSPSAFRPKPQVRSWVMRITMHDPPYAIHDEAFYADLVRVLFSHRRKTIRKTLKISQTDLGEDRTGAILSAAPAELLASRPGTLTLEEFAMLANLGAGSPG